MARGGRSPGDRNSSRRGAHGQRLVKVEQPVSKRQVRRNPTVRTRIASGRRAHEGRHPGRRLCDAASSALRRYAEDAAARRWRSDPAPDDHEPPALRLRPVRHRHRLPRAHGARRGRVVVPEPRRHVRDEPGLPHDEQRVLAAADARARRERRLHPARRRRRVRPRRSSRSSSSAAPTASRCARSARSASKRSRSPPTTRTACSRSASTCRCARRWASRSASSCSRRRRRKRLFAALARSASRDQGLVNEYYEAAFQQIIDEGATLYGVDIGSMYATEIDTVEDLDGRERAAGAAPGVRHACRRRAAGRVGIFTQLVGCSLTWHHSDMRSCCVLAALLVVACAKAGAPDVQGNQDVDAGRLGGNQDDGGLPARPDRDSVDATALRQMLRRLPDAPPGVQQVTLSQATPATLEANYAIACDSATGTVARTPTTACSISRAVVRGYRCPHRLDRDLPGRSQPI